MNLFPEIAFVSRMLACTLALGLLGCDPEPEPE
jgi:hypothetical protein